MSAPVIVEFKDKREIDRILLLLSQDRARIVGHRVIAEETLADPSVSGGKRDRARQIIETTPEQEKVVRDAQQACREGLRRWRESNE